MPYRPKSFKNALSHSNRTTVHYLLTIEKHQKILKLIRFALPYELAQEVRDCAIKNSNLLVFTTSAAWASQLRFYSQAILSSVHLNGHESIDKIQLKVLDSIYDSSPDLPDPIIPSKEIIKMIQNDQRDAADSDLKKSLLNLGKTLSKLSNS